MLTMHVLYQLSYLGPKRAGKQRFRTMEAVTGSSPQNLKPPFISARIKRCQIDNPRRIPEPENPRINRRSTRDCADACFRIVSRGLISHGQKPDRLPERPISGENCGDFHNRLLIPAWTGRISD